MAAEPRIIGSKRLRDAWPPVSEDEVQLPSGARKTWIRMHLGMSAAILAVTKEKEIVLTREYRHGLGRVAFSLPGGTAREGESPDAGAGWKRPSFRARDVVARLGCVGQDLNLRTPTGQRPQRCAFDQTGPPTHAPL